MSRAFAQPGSMQKGSIHSYLPALLQWRAMVICCTGPAPCLCHLQQALYLI